MNDLITLTGLVVSPPRLFTTGEGLPILSFRLLTTQRRFDRVTQKWVDGDTNWYTITSFRQLASNCATSITKGERVVVTGRLRQKEWTKDDKSGLNVEVEADAIGHDLSWGTTSFVRTIFSSSVPPAAAQPTSGFEGAQNAAGSSSEVSAGEATESWAPSEAPSGADLEDATVPF